MIGSAAVRLLLTAVFAIAAVAATSGWRRERGPSVFCLAMCAACVGMTWWSEPTTVLWTQAAVFCGAAVWFALPGRIVPLHVVMAAAMIWMLLAMPGAMGSAMPMGGSMPGGGSMPMGGATQMSGGTGAMGRSVMVIVGSVVVAVCCGAAAIGWVRRPAHTGHAVMSAGMAALVLAML